jgi:hypothetical protein
VINCKAIFGHGCSGTGAELLISFSRCRVFYS